MEMKMLTSSQIESVGYDNDSSTLRIKFKSGGTYDYLEVEPSVHQELLQNTSPGKYFHSNIKKVYKFEKKM